MSVRLTPRARRHLAYSVSMSSTMRCTSNSSSKYPPAKPGALDTMHGIQAVGEPFMLPPST